MSVTGGEESAPMRTDVGQVTARRERLGYTMAEFADEAGVDEDTLSALERGKRKPQTATLNKVLTALDRLEKEFGFDAPPLPEGFRYISDPAARFISYTVGQGVGQVVIQAPIEDAELAREQAEALMVRAMREARERDET